MIVFVLYLLPWTWPLLFGIVILLIVSRLNTSNPVQPIIWFVCLNHFINTGTSNNPATHFQPNWIPQNFTQWVSTLPNDTNGHISLEHDLFPISATQAPNAIRVLLNAGYKIQSPVECNGDMRPYLNQSLVIPQSMVKNSTGIGLGHWVGTSGAGRLMFCHRMLMMLVAVCSYSLLHG